MALQGEDYIPVFKYGGVLELKLLSVVNDTTNNSLSITQKADVGNDPATDGAIHIENSQGNGIALGVYSNNGADANAELISFKVDNPAFDQTLARIINDGARGCIFAEQNTGTGGGENAFDFRINANMLNQHSFQIYSNTGQSGTGRLLRVYSDSSSSTAVVAEIRNDGSNNNLLLTQNDTGTAATMELNRTGNNAAQITGIRMNLANAGAGDEAAFRFDGSEVVNAAVGGSQDMKIRVSVAGTDYFIPLNTA